MQFYPVTPVFLAVLGLCVVRGMDRVVALVAAMLPFGMLAVVNLPAVGGLSLMAVNLSAAALVGLGCLLLVNRLMRGRAIEIEPPTIALTLFILYAMFSATVLVRLFAGDVMVFSLSRGAEEGVRVSTLFLWSKVWLAPSTSNISQTFYLVVGFGFFIVATQVFSHREASFGQNCFALAATLNIVLGTMDMLGLDPVLAMVRTANYSLINGATIMGMARVVGGFPEASSFGGTTTVFAAYFASAYLQDFRPRHGWLGLLNGIFVALSLSATGMLTLAVVFVLLGLHFRHLGRIRPTPGQVLAVSLVVGLLAVAVAFLLIFTSTADTVQSVIDDVIFNKAGSSSGAERTAWAMGGLEAFNSSWGLGVGAGSIRSNGYIFVLLGSVGFLGTAFFLVFLWLTYGPTRPLEVESAQIMANARMAFAALMTAMLLSATTPDPGILFFYLAALSAAARRRVLHAAAAPGLSRRFVMERGAHAP